MHIKVQVSTGARKEEFEELALGRFLISVKEKPRENRANQRVIFLLAQHLHVPTKKIRLINGHHAPSKLFVVDVEPTES